MPAVQRGAAGTLGVGLVGMHCVRPRKRAFDGRDTVKQGGDDLGVGAVGPAQTDGKRTALPLDHKRVLRAALPRSVGCGPVAAPLFSPGRCGCPG